MSRKASRHPLGLSVTGLLLVVLLLAAVAVPGCASSTDADDAMLDARPLGVWWTGDGAFAVVQLATAEGQGVVLVWDARSGQTLQPLEGYRVVAVEHAAPRLWLVPEDDAHKVEAAGGTLDLAGDARDTQPERLLIWDLASDEAPTADAESRWRAWPGEGGYTVYPEVDVLKGALVSRLLFQPSSGETEGAKAAVPEGVVTMEPVGWAPSGTYFAAVGLGESGPLLLVFEPSSGSLVKTQPLPPQHGRVAWDVAEDRLHLFAEDELLALQASAWEARPYPAASSYRPASGSRLLGMVPAGALVWQPGDGEAGPSVWVVADPEAGGSSRTVTEGFPAPEGYAPPVSYDGRGRLAAVKTDPLRLIVQPIEGEAEIVWTAK